MTSTLMPTPDRRRPELVASLRLLRARLEEQRRFHMWQLTELTRFDQPFVARLDQPRRTPHGADGDVDATRRTLGDIETALNRIRTHRYGFCLYCGAEIPIERLHRIPQADACEACGP